MTIELSPEQIILFNVLYNAGVFDITNGSAEIHFDSEGIIRSIDIHRKVYKRVDKPIIAIKAVL